MKDIRLCKKRSQFLIDNKKYSTFKLLGIAKNFGLDLNGDIIPWRRGNKRTPDFAGVIVYFHTRNIGYKTCKILLRESHEQGIKDLRKIAQENNKYKWPKRSRKRTYWNQFLKNDKDFFVTGTQIREYLVKESKNEQS